MLAEYSAGSRPFECWPEVDEYFHRESVGLLGKRKKEKTRSTEDDLRLQKW
jgi:hypothetical protein